MLSSKEKEVRQEIVRRLLANRKKPSKKPRKKILQGMRQLEVPELQWNAIHWSKIIDWNKVKVSEPKIVSDITDQDLKKVIESPFIFPKLPLH